VAYIAARRAMGTSLDESVLRPLPFYLVESESQVALMTLDLSCPILTPKVLDISIKTASYTLADTTLTTLADVLPAAKCIYRYLEELVRQTMPSARNIHAPRSRT